MSFANMKRNSSAAINKLIESAEKLSSSKNYKSDEDGFWVPTVDKAGNGYNVIRFLPPKEGEDLPWVQYWDHGFKGSTGRWYIENSLTTLGQPDPVSEANSILWNTGRDEDKETARARKRRLHYVSNIEVISDTNNPDNEGKVFKFKYGKKIFDKIMDVMQPQFADETPINPFDFWAGANFKLKIRNVEGYRNYDKSEFDKLSVHHNGDESKLEELYNKIYSLSEIVDPKNFKSYADLKTKFLQVVGQDEAAKTYTTSERVSLDESVSKSSEKTVSSSLDNDDDANTLSYFAKLANG